MQTYEMLQTYTASVNRRGLQLLYKIFFKIKNPTNSTIWYKFDQNRSRNNKVNTVWINMANIGAASLNI